MILEYVWIDGYDQLRTKIKIQYDDTIPEWNFDGSSTGQAITENSEIILVPVKHYKNPFKKDSDSYLVLCSTYDKHRLPNNRDKALSIFKKYIDEVAWYGLEQEYFMIDNKTGLPLGDDKETGKETEKETEKDKYYCSVGAGKAMGRTLAEEHMKMCLFAHIHLSGINQEVAPGQWEFQIGPVFGLDACDDLWMARYILEKLGEKYDISINYHPKPLKDKGNFNGSGCHTNFSTQKMRDDNGLETILECMQKLENTHSQHIAVYGKHNEERLTGYNETSSIDSFTYSIGGRNCSVRIGNDTFNSKKGYFEDRRPSANMDPYLVCPLILNTCCS